MRAVQRLSRLALALATLSASLLGCSSSARSGIADPESAFARHHFGDLSQPVVQPMLAVRDLPRPSGWHLSGPLTSSYQIDPDPSTLWQGRPTFLLAPGQTVDQGDIASVGSAASQATTWSTSVPTSELRGTRVRLSATTRVSGASKPFFWARTSNRYSEKEGLGLGGKWVEIGESGGPSSGGFHKSEIVLDLDPDADLLEYGFSTEGGKLWIGGVDLQMVYGDKTTASPTYDGEERVGDWLKTGTAADAYSLTAEDRWVKVEKKADSPASIEQRRDDWIVVTRAFRADALVGSKVGAVLELKREGDVSDLSCFIRAQQTRSLSYAGAAESRLTPATRDGTYLLSAVAVPDHSKWVLVGVTYRGTGKVWLQGGDLAKLGDAPTYKLLSTH